MEEQKNYLTPAEFAKIKGVSIQSVYQRLKGGLKEFVKVENGKMLIDADALEVPTTKGVAKDFSKVSRQEPLTLSTLELENMAQKQTIEHQRETIERLQKDLNDARAKIDKKDEQIETMSARLANMIENEQELLRNSQVLVAQAQQKRGFFARLFAPKDKGETV